MLYGNNAFVDNNPTPYAMAMVNINQRHMPTYVDVDMQAMQIGLHKARK